MALIHWLKTMSGGFSDGADWSGGVAPGAGDDAILDAPGSTAYKVSVTSNATVASIQTSANALLDIEADFSAADGTGAGVNAGAIRIENGGVLTLQGTVDNTGSIEIFGTVSTTTIVLGTGGVFLTGEGAVFLNFTGGAHQQIVAAAGGSVLTLSQRISGQGLIGGAGLSIVTDADGGFLEAKGGLLTIDTGTSTIVNGGLIDAEGYPSYPYVPGQGLVESPVENNGVVEADGGGATMTFEDAVTGSGRGAISGGTLRFDSAFNQAVYFTRSTGVLALARSADYTALIRGFSSSGGEYLDLGDIGFVGAGEATFSGGVRDGVLTVTDGVHTASIHLAGDFTGSAFTVSGDGTGGVLVTAGPKAIGWLKATSGAFQTAANWAGAAVPGPNNDAVLGVDGGASYVVTASTQRTIAGLRTAANARLVLSAPMTIRAGTDGGVVHGAIVLANGGRLTFGGEFDDTGSIGLTAPTGLSEMVVTGAATLSGGGVINMADKTASAIVGAAPSAVLTNLDDTIIGAGTIGAGGLTLINGASGRILSDLAGKTLTINTGARTITNAGILQGGGGGMYVTSPVENDGLVRAVKALTFSRRVTGTGRGVIAGGALLFLGAFDQGVTFVGAGGVLGLAYSRAYDHTIRGFSTTGADALDLADIAFTGPSEATFSGNASGGVLTVGDGTHAAHIRLSGDYMGVAFSAASDGRGGTMVTAGAGAQAAMHAFIAAMAVCASGATAQIAAPTLVTAPLTMAANPRHGFQP
jgi:hypothetical protein